MINQDSVTQFEVNSVRPRWTAVLPFNEAKNVSGSGQSRKPVKMCEEPEVVPVFLEELTKAVLQLKDRLQQSYEQAYPGLGNIVCLVIDKEESTARDLSVLFPHLLLPDLVEAHMTQLGLQPRANGARQ